MDISTLREFVTLMTYRSGVKAARALNMDPSTLSRHMHALERELGVLLLEHGNKTEFTSAAFAIMPAVIDTIKAADAILDAIPRSGQSTRRPFRVYTLRGDVLCAELFSFALGELEKQGDVRIVEVDVTGEDLQSQLVNGDIDAVLGPRVADTSDGKLEHWTVVRDPMMVWFNKDSEFVRAAGDVDSISPKMMSGCVLPVSISPSLHSGYESVIASLVGENNEIRTEEVFASTDNEYFSLIRENRFFVGGKMTGAPFSKLQNSQLRGYRVDSGTLNMDRVLTVRAGEDSVASIRLLAALENAVRAMKESR